MTERRRASSRWRRAGASWCFAFVVVVTTLGVAAALGESGTKYCNPRWVKIKSLTYGSTEHRAGEPGGLTWQVAYWFGRPYLVYHYSHTERHDASWEVWTDYAINYSDTYAYCVNYG